MITFKQFLSEKALRPSVFAATIERLSGSAKMGFELEMWVPEDSDLLIISDEDSSNGDFKKTAEQAKDSLEDSLGYDVTINGDSAKGWVIVPDGSIQAPGVGCGIEIVSPPDPVEDSLADLRQMFRWMTKHDVITNSTTGLHLNLSIPEIKEKLDPLKLILFMGESHVLSSYDRKLNTYAKEHGADLIDTIKNTGKLPNDAAGLKRYATHALQDVKYRTVNLSKLKDGYLEFRTAGNENYHKKFDQVAGDVGRFLTVLELACDPDAEKQEYAKKIVKLFNAGRDAKGRGTNYSYTNSKPGSLEHLAEKSRVDLLKVAIDSENADRIKTRLMEIMFVIGHKINTGIVDTIPTKTVAEFKILYAKALKLAPEFADDIKDIRNDETVEGSTRDVRKANINTFIKAFNLK